jgi:CheY-specific phosphatase CheX
MLAKVTVAEGARAAADAPEHTKLELINPFVEAAGRVILQECREVVGKGQLHRVRSPQTSRDVSALIAITGSVGGLVIYSLSLETASNRLHKAPSLS